MVLDRVFEPLQRLLLVGAVTLGMWVGVSPAAFANEEESTEARLLVVQAISFIANGADAEVVIERIGDAIDAPDQAGVDAAKVAQALAIVEDGEASGDAGAFAAARAVLASAVDVRAASGYGEIPAPGDVGQDAAPYAAGADSGTTVVLDELKPTRGLSDNGDIALFTIAVLLLAAGFVLSRRWRPDDSVRELRRRSATIDQQESV